MSSVRIYKNNHKVSYCLIKLNSGENIYIQIVHFYKLLIHKTFPFFSLPNPFRKIFESENIKESLGIFLEGEDYEKNMLSEKSNSGENLILRYAKEFSLRCKSIAELENKIKNKLKP